MATGKLESDAGTQFVSVIGAVTFTGTCILIPETDFVGPAVAELPGFADLLRHWLTVLQLYAFWCVKGKKKMKNQPLPAQLSPLEQHCLSAVFPDRQVPNFKLGHLDSGSAAALSCSQQRRSGWGGSLSWPEV